ELPNNFLTSLRYLPTIDVPHFWEASNGEVPDPQAGHGPPSRERHNHRRQLPCTRSSTRYRPTVPIFRAAPDLHGSRPRRLDRGQEGRSARGLPATHPPAARPTHAHEPSISRPEPSAPQTHSLGFLSSALTLGRGGPPLHRWAEAEAKLEAVSDAVRF